MTTYDLTSTTPSSLRAGDIINCPYSGSVKEITLPSGEYQFECWGAQGGEGTKAGGTYSAGKGGYSKGTLILNKGSVFYLCAGGQGQAGSSTAKIGGFNGGGAVSATSSSYRGGAGGGGSDIRIGQNSLYARIIVAGGGGGSAGYYGSGGYGGGTAGESVYYSSTSTAYATGGSQTSGGTCSGSYGGTNGANGTFGNGGKGGESSSSAGTGAGGGGGWYGGAGGKSGNSNAAQPGGGGGSGYVYKSDTASNYPSGCLLNSSVYLSDAETKAGNVSFTSPTGTSETGHTGDGYVRITVINVGPDVPVAFIKINNEWIQWKL